MSEQGAQKTYDPQTAQFLSVVAQNMPRLDSPKMQAWIQRPKTMQRLLNAILGKGPDDWVKPARVSVESPDSKANAINYEWPVLIPVAPSVGAAVGLTDGAWLRLGVEYDANMPVLRPWLEVEVVGADENEFEGVWMRSLEYWSGHSSATLHYLINIEQEVLIPRELYRQVETDYAESGLELIKYRHTFSVGCDETLEGWMIHLHWLQNGGSTNSFRFRLTRKAILTEFRDSGKKPPKHLGR